MVCPGNADFTIHQRNRTYRNGPRPACVRINHLVLVNKAAAFMSEVRGGIVVERSRTAKEQEAAWLFCQLKGPISARISRPDIPIVDVLNTWKKPLRARKQTTPSHSDTAIVVKRTDPLVTPVDLCEVPDLSQLRLHPRLSLSTPWPWPPSE